MRAVVPWQEEAMLDWLRRRQLREGLVITVWIGRHRREDRLVVDLSRLGEGLVGIRRRRYLVMRTGAKDAPAYRGEVEFVPLRKLRSIVTWGRV